MTALGQHRRFEERCPNDRFLIRKRPLRVAPMNGRFWPMAAVALKSSRMSVLSLGCVETLAEAGHDPWFCGLAQ